MITNQAKELFSSMTYVTFINQIFADVTNIFASGENLQHRLLYVSS